MYTIQRFDSPNWVSLGSIAGLGESSYIYEATTLIDSLGQGNDSTSFKLLHLISFRLYILQLQWSIC